MIVLGAGGVAGYSRYLRASMLDVLGQDYMRTARSKGLAERVVWFAHGARNALIPLATFLGPAIAFVWGGAFVTETIFSWPGIGRLTLQSIVAQDYAMIMAVTVFSALATVIGYIISDVLYALIDPRIRFG
jgi:peptide/nickel transport system permease protein